MCLVLLARRLANHSKQVEIVNKIADDLLFPKSSYQLRLTYLEVASNVMDQFSRRFFNDNMLSNVMKLASVSVSNYVKSRLISTLVEIC